MQTAHVDPKNIWDLGEEVTFDKKLMKTGKPLTLF
jgi:hypothetical protein